MRAVVIDPFAEAVTEIDFDGTSAELKRLLDNAGRPLAAYPYDRERKHVIYVDDEALLIDQTGQRYFSLIGKQDIIGGKAVVLDQKNGKDLSCTLSTDKVLAGLLWRNDLEFAGIRESAIDGGDFTIIRRTADWRPRDEPEPDPGTYRCAICGEEFQSAWNEAQARAEFEARFPGQDLKDACPICDDCEPKMISFLADLERNGNAD